MIDRPLRIFLSSTYKDLKSKRKSIINLIKRLGHVSKEMESFSAGRRHQWGKIKDEIDESDIVVVISASSYGTIFKNGKSFTESEVDYAIKKEKQIIPILSLNFDKNNAALESFRAKLEKYTPKYYKSTADLILETVCAIRDVEKFPKKWKISDKTNALTTLNDSNDWVVDGNDIYYEPNSEYGIIVEPEQAPTDNWEKQYETFQSDTMLGKEIWDRFKIQDINGIDFSYKFFDIKIVKGIRPLNTFRANVFYIRHFPSSLHEGVYFLPSHEIMRTSLRNKIKEEHSAEDILNIIKDMPEYKACKILFNNTKNGNDKHKDDNDFILKYLDVAFLKKIEGIIP